MEANPDSIKGVQASESFKVTAHGDGALSQGGQQVGFAKYQFDGNAHEQLGQLSNQVRSMQDIINRPINGFQNLMNNVAESPDDVDLQAQIPGKMQAVQEAFAKVKERYPDLEMDLPDLSDDPNVMMQQAVQFKDDYNAQNAHAVADYGEVGKIAAMAENLYAPNTPKVDKPNDRSLLARAVASHEVDNFLQTNVIAAEKFGIDKNDRAIGISVQADGAGVTGKYHDEDAYLEVDYSSPEVQKGLSDLEAMDYITGQIDRHAGNMFIDTNTGKVTGIDNDMAFPEMSRQDMVNAKGEYTAKMVGGLPSMLHQDTPPTSSCKPTRKPSEST